MIFKVRRHVQVEEDILDLANYIAQDSETAAYRFLDAAEETIVGLRHMPGKGSPKGLRGRGLSGIRSWAIRGFPNHLIFYDFQKNNVYVLAVIHGSRRYISMVRERADGK